MKNRLAFAGIVLLVLVGSLYVAYRKSHAPLLTIQRTEELGDVEFSPDGRTVAICTDQGVLIYQTVNWKQVNFLAGPTNYIGWLPGSQTLLTIGTQFASAGIKQQHDITELARWNTLSGKQISRHVINGYGLLTVSPGLKMAVLHTRSGITIINTDDGSVVPHSSRLAAFEPQFSPDGRYFASVRPTLEKPASVHIWNVENWQELSGKAAPKITATCLRFSPDGKILATGTPQAVTLWDTNTWKVLHTFPAHFRYLFRLRFSPDGARLAGGGRYEGKETDFFWTLWNAESGNVIANNHHTYFWGFLPHGKVAMTADTGTALWDQESGRKIWNSVDHIDYLGKAELNPPIGYTFLDISPDSRTLVTATVYSLPNGEDVCCQRHDNNLLQIWNMPH